MDEQNGKKWIILYGTILEIEDGAFFDFPFFAGIVNNPDEAAKIFRDLVNDTEIPGHKIPKTFEFSENNGSLTDIIIKARRIFLGIANNIYEEEDKNKKRTTSKK